ncbi:hypothetical protein [Plesiomonas sp. ZOR0011]|uniref:hypothetical protein n=1 Tax=Plesiomonas sp. ZOR0011 TaxID=1339230 RepID=UPI000647DC7D|nr:hypothetical protein [Plesiomonas sp. ZOR0011]
MRLRNDFKNPYANTVQCIISEILQLLLIVERIKADEEAIRRLRSLVSLYEKFNELSEPYPQYFLYENKANSAQVLLCDVLDQGLKATFFLIKIIDFVESQPPYRRSENRELSKDDPHIDSWHKNLSKIIDSEQYGFENLSPWRLHYPHQQIVLAYLHGEELIKKVNQLKQLDFKESINTASDRVINEYSNAFGSGVDKEVKELILEQHINSRATEWFAEKISFIIDDINRVLSWSFDEGSYFANHKIEKKTKEMGGPWGGRDAEQSVLTIDVLESEIKAAIEKTSFT